MAKPASRIAFSVSWEFAVVGKERMTILMDVAVTPRAVSPPLSPVNLATQGSEYWRSGTCFTPSLHATPPRVVPEATSTAPDPGFHDPVSVVSPAVSTRSPFDFSSSLPRPGSTTASTATTTAIA